MSPSSQMMTGCDSAASLGHEGEPKIPIGHRAQSIVMSTGCGVGSFVCNEEARRREIKARPRLPSS